MKILAHAFTMVPTNDLADSVSACAAGGLKVYWRPDPRTALLGVNDRACVMVEDDSSERALGPGPVLLVDDVGRISLDDSTAWAISPIKVPVGTYAASKRGGTVLRYLDLSRLEDDIPRVLFGDSCGAGGSQGAGHHGK